MKINFISDPNGTVYIRQDKVRVRIDKSVPKLNNRYWFSDGVWRYTDGDVPPVVFTGLRIVDIAWLVSFNNISVKFI